MDKRMKTKRQLRRELTDLQSEVTRLQDDLARANATLTEYAQIVTPNALGKVRHLRFDGNCPDCGSDAYFENWVGGKKGASYCMACGYNDRLGDQLVGLPPMMREGEEHARITPTKQLASHLPSRLPIHEVGWHSDGLRETSS